MPRARSSNSMGLQEEHLFYGTRSKDSRNAGPMHFQEGSLPLGLDRANLSGL